MSSWTTRSFVQANRHCWHQLQRVCRLFCTGLFMIKRQAWLNAIVKQVNKFRSYHCGVIGGGMPAITRSVRLHNEEAARDTTRTDDEAKHAHIQQLKEDDDEAYFELVRQTIPLSFSHHRRLHPSSAVSVHVPRTARIILSQMYAPLRRCILPHRSGVPHMFEDELLMATSMENIVAKSMLFEPANGSQRRRRELRRRISCTASRFIPNPYGLIAPVRHPHRISELDRHSSVGIRSLPVCHQWLRFRSFAAWRHVV